jgi:gentisate 1,2-dioxygenase
MTSLNTWFQEELPDPAGEPQALKPIDDSLSLFGQGTLLPTWHYEHHAYSPLMRYKGDEAIGRLLALGDQPGSPYDGVALAYTNPTTGGHVLPTIACWIQILRPCERTQAHRHTSSAVYHVMAGRGHSVLNGERFDWGEHDIFILPNWTWHEHANASDTEPAILFSFGDTPVLQALDLYREQAYTDNRGHQPVLTTFGQRSGESTPG